MEKKDKKPRAPRKKPSPLTKAGQPRKKTGVPAVKNTPENFFKVLQLIELEGLSARKAMLKVGVSSDLFDKWLDSDELNSKQYARACCKRADMIFDEMLELADKQDCDIHIDDKGIKRVDFNLIHRNKLQIDTRKWMLSKMMPKKYGDKVDITTNNESLNTPKGIELNDDQITKLIDKL